MRPKSVRFHVWPGQSRSKNSSSSWLVAPNTRGWDIPKLLTSAFLLQTLHLFAGKIPLDKISFLPFSQASSLPIIIAEYNRMVLEYFCTLLIYQISNHCNVFCIPYLHFIPSVLGVLQCHNHIETASEKVKLNRFVAGPFFKKDLQQTD